jgi:hypothetical protein
VTKNDILLYGFDDFHDRNTLIKKHIEEELDGINTSRLMEIEIDTYMDHLSEDFVQEVFCQQLSKYFE